VGEEAKRLAIASRAKASPSAIAPAEIDLRCVLRGDNSPSLAGRRRSPACRSQYFFRRHMLGVEKAVHRHLSCAITSDLAQHQRPGLHHAFEQRGTGPLPTHITKVAKVKFPFMRHHRPLKSPQGTSESQPRTWGNP
jgi:hypothetical protein